MENAIIGATADILNGTEEVCGVVTSGGTESCLMAVKTYRDMARDRRGVRRPEMILPTTAHVAWFKASEYFGVKVRLVPLLDDMTLNLRKLRRMINRNTVMILGSAPEYPHGTIDPIAQMGEIAAKRGIPLHVDACVGGFILPFMEMNGETLPPWDYRVPGVTSISADIHKYGYAAKGALHHHLSQPGLPALPDVRIRKLARRRIRLLASWARARGAPMPRPGVCCSISASRATGNWRPRPWRR